MDTQLLVAYIGGAAALILYAWPYIKPRLPDHLPSVTGVTSSAPIGAQGGFAALQIVEQVLAEAGHDAAKRRALCDPIAPLLLPHNEVAK